MAPAGSVRLNQLEGSRYSEIFVSLKCTKSNDLPLHFLAIAAQLHTAFGGIQP